MKLIICGVDGILSFVVMDETFVVELLLLVFILAISVSLEYGSDLIGVLALPNTAQVGVFLGLQAPGKGDNLLHLAGWEFCGSVFIHVDNLAWCHVHASDRDRHLNSLQ